MMILKYISILLLAIFFASFQKDESTKFDFLIQKWVYKNYEKGKFIYESNRKFKKDKAGIEFKENGTIIKQQNSGWCGTPPIEYENVTGTWKKISDSLIVLEYKNWAGSNKDTMKIIEISKSKLTLKWIYTLKKE